MVDFDEDEVKRWKLASLGEVALLQKAATLVHDEKQTDANMNTLNNLLRVHVRFVLKFIMIVITDKFYVCLGFSLL